MLNKSGIVRNSDAIYGGRSDISNVIIIDNTGPTNDVEVHEVSHGRRCADLALVAACISALQGRYEQHPVACGGLVDRLCSHAISSHHRTI